MTLDGELPQSLFAHKRLRGGRMDDREKACPGNEGDWAILKNIYLGVATQTEVLELQLRNIDGKPLDKVPPIPWRLRYGEHCVCYWELRITKLVLMPHPPGMN